MMLTHSISRLLTATLIAFSLFIHQSQAADYFKWRPGQVLTEETNGPDGIDDLWQEIFNAWGLPPEGDADHDGSTNLTESVAGTNPFTSDESLRVDNIEPAGGAVCVCHGRGREALSALEQ